MQMTAARPGRILLDQQPLAESRKHERKNLYFSDFVFSWLIPRRCD